MDPVSGDTKETIFDEEVTGEVRKILQPTSENDAKLRELKTFLIDWINHELKQEHIVVKSLEEDLFDGLILHHLLQKIAKVKIEVEEITLSVVNQRRKLGLILDAVSSCMQLEEEHMQWDLNLIHSKDLLATLHLLVALARHFKPDLPLPENVSVEVVVMEPTKTRMKTGKAIEFITRSSEENAAPKKDGFDQLFELNPEKVEDVKQVMLNFVNKQLVNLSLTVTDLDTQFADGVILLLLIGQLEGFFVNLSSFFLTPTSYEDKLHNVSLALELLIDGGILEKSVDPSEIVSGDMKPTLRVLYSLFLRHKKNSKPS